MGASAWHKMDVEPATGRCGIAGDQIEGRHVPGGLQPGDNGLGRAQPGRDLSLGEASRLARLDHLAHHGEDGPEAAVFGLTSGSASSFCFSLASLVMT